MTKALSPSEVEQIHAEGLHLPPEVIEVVNDLLVKKGSSNYITLKISVVQKAICERMNISEATLDEHPEWLDFESYYRAVGWQCRYDRPGYNESYEGFYEFGKEKR